MRKFLFILFSLCNLTDLKAQIAKWLISPLYENIQLVDGTDMIMTDSAGVKTLWTMDGKRLFSTKDKIFPFKEGIALSLKPGTSQISMAYKEHGEKINLSGCSVVHGYPYYSNGKLLVRKESFYRFVDIDGNIQVGRYVSAYPYFNGYATCDTYLNMEKQKDPCHFLIDENGNQVSFNYQGKLFDKEDVQFISSVNDENTGVIVVKSKVFFFNGKNKELTPVFATDNPSPNLKEQVRIVSDIEQSFLQNTDSTYLLYAKYGKEDKVTICFDLMRRPVSIKCNETETFYKKSKEEKKSYKSDLEIKKDNNLFGLYWNNFGEMLPPQFEKVTACFADKALVKLKGKYGMLKIVRDAKFRLKMNKGDDVAFMHQKFETSVRADFPTFLSADKVNIEINPQTGCDIDKTSKNYKNTNDGNFVEYNCVLNIPANLPDELTTIKYPVTIYYDGFKSSEIQFDVNAWHYKYFVVDVDDSQTTLENGNVSFVFNINVDKRASDAIYPITVSFLTDSLHYMCDKMVETRYKCKVFSLKEGVNNIVIQILEQGCPPATFPFEVEYYKPIAKTRNKPAEKEKVTIKKKENVVRQTNNEANSPKVIM